MGNRFRLISLMLAAALVCLQLTAMAKDKESDAGYSHVRVVRLSFVDGTVLVRRPGSMQWAKAAVNTPIEQGFSLSTDNNSYAEVEFENGSTARLGQLSQIDFTELALSPRGAKVNRMTFDHGYATFHVTEHHGDAYSVQVGTTTLTPSSKAEFRTDFSNGTLRVEVFDGSVEAANSAQPGKTAKVTKDKALTITPQTEDAFNITHGLTKDSWDQWVHERDQQVALAFNDSSVAPSSSMYGWSDLDTYGEWGFFPGYGYGWSPFVAAGWTPFSMGQWSFYPGMGYTWISSEPWGWLPFHYGSWNYLPNFGYFWVPGSFGAFSPATVAWFTGPGYVGWAPMGAGGAPVCATGKACVTAVKPATLQNGAPVNSTTRLAVNANQLTRIESPRLAPGSSAMLSGRLVAERGAVQAGEAAALRPESPATARAARAGFAAATAPRIVIMGQTAAQSARMDALAGHHSVFSRSSERPLTAHMGTTLGGSFVVRQSFRNAETMNRPAGFGREAPVFLSHRSATGFAGPRYQMTRSGAVRAEGGGMRASAPSYEGSRGGMESAPSVHMSAPAMSAAHTSAPSGGGPHR